MLPIMGVSWLSPPCPPRGSETLLGPVWARGRPSGFLLPQVSVRAQPCSGLTGHGSEEGACCMHFTDVVFFTTRPHPPPAEREALALLGLLGGLTWTVFTENETVQHCSPPGTHPARQCPGARVLPGLARWSDFPKPQLWGCLPLGVPAKCHVCEGLFRAPRSVLWLCVCVSVSATLQEMLACGAVGRRSPMTLQQAHTGEDRGRGAQGGASEGRCCSGDVAAQHRHLPPSATRSRAGREQSLVGGTWAAASWDDTSALLCSVLNKKRFTNKQPSPERRETCLG